MPMISESKINEIRESADIVDIIKNYIPLELKGKNYFGVCPFHQDHSPSMSVSKEKQMYKCFSCGAAGNVFTFVSNYENIPFIEAVVKVAGILGISVGDYTTTQPKEKYEREYNAMDLALKFYQNTLRTKDGGTAREYLLKRGLNEEMQKVFDIGLSTTSDKLYPFLKQKGMDEKFLFDLGLIIQEEGSIKDTFKDRILFPIHDAKGHAVGFTGRVYKGDYKPKYLNSKENYIFKKGNILFNYHRARDAIRTKKEVVIVEGNMDAIRMYVSGIKNTIALMGVSLTKEQIDLIRNLHATVILMLDNDEAGRTATLTNGEALESAGITCKVVRLSGEKDPDEYILKNGVQQMIMNIAHAESYLEFKIKALKDNKDLTDATVLSSYIKSVLQSISDEDAITKEVTINKLVEDYNLDKDLLNNELKKMATNNNVNVKVVARGSLKKKINKEEISARSIIYYMMNDYKYIKMYQTNLGYFKSANYRGMANEILYYMTKNKTMNFADFMSYVAVSPLKEEFETVIRDTKIEDFSDSTFLDYILNIKESRIKGSIKECKKIIKDSSDILEQEKEMQKIITLKSELEKIIEERSVKK